LEAKLPQNGFVFILGSGAFYFRIEVAEVLRAIEV
jgi:hypothetical protein